MGCIGCILSFIWWCMSTSGIVSIALKLMVLFGYMGVVGSMSDLVVAMLADRAGSSGRGLWPLGSFGLVVMVVVVVAWMGCGTFSGASGVLDSSDFGALFPAAAAAAAACC